MYRNSNFANIQKYFYKKTYTSEKKFNFSKKMNRFKPNIYKNIILIFIILGTLGILNFFISNIINDQNNKSISSINIGGNFKLIDQKNNVYDSVNNKVYKLIYFGYTYCPDVCPFDILKLSRLFKENPKLKKYIEPIFITVDPERDSVEVMRNFLVNFDEGIIGLTGSIEEITEVLKKYKIFKRKSDINNSDTDYLIDHTSLFYFVGKDNLYINHFSSKDFVKTATEYFKKFSF